VNRRRAIWIGLFAAVITLFVALVLLVSADGLINRTVFNQIEQGMSEDEVLSIVGIPPTGWDKYGHRRWWCGRHFSILVEFDDQGRVTRKLFPQSPSQLESLWWSVRGLF
jgi:hypothetical protein